jgi:(E)-4-hydroxy-3-methylbut-2-enyl-diphosphate synthase
VTTLRGPSIADDFKVMVDDYIRTRFGGQSGTAGQ